MNLLFLIIIGILIYVSVLLGGKRFRNTALYALAIGGAVNANFFHAGNYPIDIFGLKFGLDGIIYNLFIFAIIVMLFKSNKGQAYLLSFSSIIAIMIAALFQLFADILSNGNNLNAWIVFSDFTASAFVSVIVVIIVLELLNFLRNKTRLKNEYILLAIGMVIATLINTPVYYTFQSIIHGTPSNIWELILTSFLCKMLSTVISIGTLFLINLYDKKTTKKVEN